MYVPVFEDRNVLEDWHFFLLCTDEPSGEQAEDVADGTPGEAQPDNEQPAEQTTEQSEGQVVEQAEAGKQKPAETGEQPAEAGETGEDQTEKGTYAFLNIVLIFIIKYMSLPDQFWV